MDKDNNKNRFKANARELGLSRSAKKRASQGLQKLGEELCELGTGERKKLPLTADILEALEVLDRIRDREGRRRQIKFVGALLRETDPEPISAGLANIKSAHSRDVLLFQQAENWRKKLLECPDGEERKIMEELYNSSRMANGSAPKDEEFLEILTRARARNSSKAPGDHNPNYMRILFGMITKMLDAGQE